MEKCWGPPNVSAATLPAALWESHVLCHLDTPALAHLAATNRELHDLASCCHVWQQHYQRDWGGDGGPASAYAAASVLGAPARPLPRTGPSDALLQTAAAQGDEDLCGDDGASPPSPGTPKPTWRQLYRTKKETEANWRSGRFAQARLRGHRDYLRCLDLQGGGARLLSASGSFAEKDCSIRVWDLREGRCVERLVGHEGPIWSMQGDGGRLVASVGDDGTLRVWDLELHRVGVSRHLGPERVGCLSWDVAAGQLAAAGEGGGIAIWSVERVQRALQEAEHLDIDPPGQPDPAADGGAAEEEEQGEEEMEFPPWREVDLDAAAAPSAAVAPQPPEGPWPAITCMQLEGGVLLTGEGGRDGRVHVWDAGQAADGRPPTLASTLGPHVGGVSCLAYQRDTGAVAVGSVRGELRLWDLARCDQGLRLPGHKRDVLCMQLGSGRALATGSADKTVRLWDARSGQCTRRLALPAMPYCLQMDEARLAVGCSDGNVRMWDLRRCEAGAGAGGRDGRLPPLLVLPGHTERVWALAMDECSLVSAGLDGDILVRSFLPGGAQFQGWPEGSVMEGAAA